MTHLKIGDKAPGFSGNNQIGEQVKLSDFSGNKVIIFFYPKASTPGCTAEAKNLRDNYDLLKSKGYEVIGISADTEKRQFNFHRKNELPYNLISDETKTIIEAYGVWGPKKLAGREYEGIYRTTFVVNEKGILDDVITKVKTKAHTEQILAENI